MEMEKFNTRQNSSVRHQTTKRSSRKDLGVHEERPRALHFEQIMATPVRVCQIQIFGHL